MKNLKKNDYIKISVASILILLLYISFAFRTPEDTKSKAEDGDKNAQYELAQNYANGTDIIEQDYDEAIKWYTQAAEQGHILSQFNLGVIYNSGEEVERDPFAAVKWWSKAAEKGYAPAQYNLGLMYDSGQGVDRRNTDTALQWWKKAADQGLPDAMNSVGMYYEIGDDFASKDYVNAYMWISLAAERKQIDAMKEIYRLEARMTPERVSEGKRLAQKWKEAHPKASKQ
jgi:TPR repeat protein